MDNKFAKSREEMLTELDIPEEKWDYFTDMSVVIMYQKFKTINTEPESNDERLLFFLNEIYETLGYKRIDNINEFDISRDAIVKLDGEKFIDKYKHKLIQYDINPSNDLNYFTRKATKTYGLSVLKGLTKYYGYNLKNKIKSNTIDGKRYDVRHYYLEKDVSNGIDKH